MIRRSLREPVASNPVWNSLDLASTLPFVFFENNNSNSPELHRQLPYINLRLRSRAGKKPSFQPMDWEAKRYCTSDSDWHNEITYACVAWTVGDLMIARPWLHLTPCVPPRERRSSWWKPPSACKAFSNASVLTEPIEHLRALKVFFLFWKDSCKDPESPVEPSCRIWYFVRTETKNRGPSLFWYYAPPGRSGFRELAKNHKHART